MEAETDVAAAMNCPQAAEAVACALNPANGSAAREAHRAACPVCRREAEAACATVAWLRGAPEADPSPGLVDRILTALPPPRHRCFVLRRRLAAAAAVFLAGALWFAAQQMRRAMPSDRGRWLTRTQHRDGVWEPIGIATPTAPYTPALTALAALALERLGPAHRAAVDRAIAALLAGQQPDGAFGPPGRCRAYNHGMTTAALLAIRQIRPSAVSEAPLRLAVDRIRATQHADGAWGYDIGIAPNTAITVWQTDALIRARASGWGDPGGHLRKAVRWLKSQQTGDGRFAYDRAAGGSTATLDAMGYAILLEASLPAADHLALARQAAQALQEAASPGRVADFYRDYFIARALDAAGVRAQAAAIRQRVAALQAVDGAWAIADRWTPVGGELYATALALLTLN
ncbi:MAG: terpene cyclase/mutase family protein [Lentisphaerae bacterium]|nr:terpene cyclase/mutase family protein [Lentisphaerota bacterium]